MNPVIIIPSRYQSSRFPGKPLALIQGKPMIQWVYEAAAKAKNIDAIYVATDDDRIARKVELFGGNVVMTSQDAASGSDRIAEAAHKLNLKNDQLIVNLQGDQPLIKPEIIADLIRTFEDFPHTKMATLAIQLNDRKKAQSPDVVKVVMDQKGFALYFSRAPIPFERDSDEHAFQKHIGVYAYKKEFLDRFKSMSQGKLEQIEKLEQLRVLEAGFPIKVVESQFESPDVDVPHDIEAVEALLDKNI